MNRLNPVSSPGLPDVLTNTIRRSALAPSTTKVFLPSSTYLSSFIEAFISELIGLW